MASLLDWLLKRQRLEERKDSERKRLVHIETHVSQLEELASDTIASRVYKATIDEFRMKADDARASIAALNKDLEKMEVETQTQEEDYDDADRQELVEEYKKIASGARERLKRDTTIGEQSEREIARLARDVGNFRGHRALRDSS